MLYQDYASNAKMCYSAAQIRRRKRMKKIVINRCFGGFGLSQEALIELQKRNDKFVYLLDGSVMWDDGILHLNTEDVERDNPNLVEVVENLGSRASSDCAELKIVEIPDDVDYTIAEYDGIEWVAEAHRTWS